MASAASTRVSLYVLAALLSLHLMYTASLVRAEEGGRGFFFYMYGSSACPHCARLHGFFEQYYRGHYSFCDMEYSRGCRDAWLAAASAAGLRGDELGIPTVFVVVNGSLAAVVVGEVEDKGFWDRLASSSPVNGSLVPLYYGPSFVRYLNISDPRGFVEEYLAGGRGGGGAPGASTGSPASLAAALVFLALIDSVNPCTIMVYTGLLLASASMGRVRGVLRGASFILGVVTGYMALGLGLAEFFSMLPYWAGGLAAFIYGFILLHKALGEKEEACRVEDGGCGLAGKLWGAPAYILGLTVSLTLLPCSAGPYIVFASLIAPRPLPEKITLLLVYNMVFTLPLWLILAAYAAAKKLGRLAAAWQRHGRGISVATALILMIIGLYLLAS